MGSQHHLPWNATVEAILEELQQLRQGPRSRDVVQWIQARLSRVEDLAAKMLLPSELAGELDLIGDHVGAEHYLRERISLSDNAAAAWISLADHHLFATRDTIAARAASENALANAIRQGAFVRQAAGTRIRVALAARDYSCVEDTLRFLLT